MRRRRAGTRRHVLLVRRWGGHGRNRSGRSGGGRVTRHMPLGWRLNRKGVQAAGRHIVQGGSHRRTNCTILDRYHRATHSRRSADIATILAGAQDPAGAPRVSSAVPLPPG